MDYFSWQFVIWATALGALSAVSLPMGSLVALRINPRPAFISIMAAFGAGALIAALSLELVAPTVFALHERDANPHTSEALIHFFALLTGLVLGGILFVILDQLVNAHGGFLRKAATSISYFTIAERKRQENLVKKISQLPFLHNVSAHHINTLVSMVRPRRFSDGEVIATQGTNADRLFFVVEGTLQVTRDGSSVEGAGLEDVIGLVPIVMQISFPVTITAKGPVAVLALYKEDFDHLRTISTAFDQVCRDMTSKRLEMLEQLVTARQEQAVQWAHEATHALKAGTHIPTAVQLQQAREKHEGAPLAIWLGILLDGIPESFVIGAGLLVLLQAKVELIGVLTFTEVIPYTLIAGLFLSNFPEALASSANMQLQGWSTWRIFLMWFSLMVITAIGAGVGYCLAGALTPVWLIFAGGLAAGAMLTMIASAMIPEAVHMGNANAVGLSTLFGFLAAISFKLLE